MTRAALALVVVLAPALACRDEPGDGDFAGVETPATRSPPAASCPPDAPILGVAGQTHVDRFELAWQSNGAESYVPGYLYFVIPDDILSLLVAVEQGAEYTAINGMAIDGEPLVDLPNAIGEPPFYHWPVEVASVTMPISRQTSARSGCLAVDPVAYADLRGEAGALHIVTRRGPTGPSRLDINVFVVGETELAPADLDAAIAHMAWLYEAGGAATIGDVTVTALDWPSAFVDAEGAEAGALRAATSTDRPNAINFLFVQDFNEVGTLGIAAGIPGPNGVPGTAASGVMVSVDTHLDGDGVSVLAEMMGETMAHEAGHQLGLFHTSEDSGVDHDPIDDTPECGVDQDLDEDGEVSAEECASAGGRNFMFWTAAEEFGQHEMSALQAMVLRDSVIARLQ